MNKTILSILLSLALSSTTFAADQVITLKDGSTIKGELAGVSPGFYTLHTATMGDVKIATSNVVSISEASLSSVSNNAMVSPSTTTTTSSFSPDINQRIESTQAKIMNNPQAMDAIKDMMNDPELMKLLTDPSITKAVMSRDVHAIENNPKAKELMNNPKMQAFMKQLGNGSSSSN